MKSLSEKERISNCLILREMFISIDNKIHTIQEYILCYESFDCHFNQFNEQKC